MPIEFSVDEAENLITTRFFGCIKNEDLFDYLTRLHTNPAFRSGIRELVLTSEVTEVENLADAVFSIGVQAMEKSAQKPNIRIAIHAPTDRLFGFARIYTSLTEESHWQTQVFRDLDEARQWLFNREPVSAIGDLG